MPTLDRIAACLSLLFVLLNASCCAPSSRSKSTEDAAEARVHYNRGKACLDDILAAVPPKGEYGKASAEFSRAIRLQPDYAEAYSARGHTQHYAGKSARAIEECSRAILLEPDGARPRESLSTAKGMRTLGLIRFSCSRRSRTGSSPSRTEDDLPPKESP